MSSAILVFFIYFREKQFGRPGDPDEMEKPHTCTVVRTAGAKAPSKAYSTVFYRNNYLFVPPSKHIFFVHRECILNQSQMADFQSSPTRPAYPNYRITKPHNSPNSILSTKLTNTRLLQEAATVVSLFFPSSTPLPRYQMRHFRPFPVQHETKLRICPITHLAADLPRPDYRQKYHETQFNL